MSRDAGNIREIPVHDSVLVRPQKRAPTILMSDRTAPDQAILRTLTFDPEPPDNLIVLDATGSCQGGYLCDCAGCVLEKARRQRAGVRGGGRQPWQHRRAA